MIRPCCATSPSDPHRPACHKLRAERLLQGCYAARRTGLLSWQETTPLALAVTRTGIEQRATAHQLARHLDGAAMALGFVTGESWIDFYQTARGHAVGLAVELGRQLGVRISEVEA